MAMQKYSTPTPQRILLRAEAKLLKHVEMLQVLGKFGMNVEQPLNTTDTVSFRRVKPFNSTAAEVPNIDPSTLMTEEGVTPSSHTIEYVNITSQLKNYGVLYQYSSDVELMYAEDIPQDMLVQCGDTLGEALEIVCYGQLKSGSNVIYANGEARSAVNSSITTDKLRLAARTLDANRARKVTKVVKGGQNYGSTPVAPSYVVFIHSDCNANFRDLEYFRSIEAYGGAFTPVCKDEIGKVEEFRIVSSPLFKPFLAGGAVIGTTGMLSANETNIDVYPVCIIAEDCLGHVSLKGRGKPNISPHIVRSSDVNHSNPMRKFGYVGADAYYSAIRLNENWMVRVEIAVKDLA